MHYVLEAVMITSRQNRLETFAATLHVFKQETSI